MDTVKQQIEVSLGDRSYPIYVGSGLVSSFAATCQNHGIRPSVVLLTDSTVARWYLKPIEKNLMHFGFQVLPIIIPPGEKQKSLARANNVFTSMLKAGVGRASALIALGGGVVGDLGGFIAATYHRGIDLVQVPTTLLSQVDSSIGGKTAVNHALGKNMIGAFYQPKFVWTDMDCLKTLPEREIVCGLGEIIKYGVIADEKFFSYLESHLTGVLRLDRDEVRHVQATCSAIKAGLVSRDEKESGIRVILNFGHTIGHALEAAGHFNVLKHGEAVLLGMVAESYIAKELGMISNEIHERIVNLVRRVPLKARLDALSRSKIQSAMSHDKKSVGGKKRFVLPTRIGEVKVVENVEPKLISESLQLIFKKVRKASAG